MSQEPQGIRSILKLQLRVSVHITDTAGLRDTDDIVEKLGIEKTWDAIKKADITIIIDEVMSKQKNYEKKFEKKLVKSQTIIIKNKIDLFKQKPLVSYQQKIPIVYISAKNGDGISLVEKEILKIIDKEKSSSNKEDLFMARSRHIIALEKVKDTISKALLNLKAPELVAEELMLAQKSLKPYYR